MVDPPHEVLKHRRVDFWQFDSCCIEGALESEEEEDRVVPEERLGKDPGPHVRCLVHDNFG
jgi:hypothetical protein